VLRSVRDPRGESSGEHIRVLLKPGGPRLHRLGIQCRFSGPSSVEGRRFRGFNPCLRGRSNADFEAQQMAVPRAVVVRGRSSK